MPATKLRTNLRKLFAAQLAVCVVCSNATYVFSHWNLSIAALQTTILCAITYALVQFFGKNVSIAIGAAVWVGLLSSASLFLALSIRSNDVTFDEGIFDRGFLFLGLICALLCLLFWCLLPWEPLEDEIYHSR